MNSDLLVALRQLEREREVPSEEIQAIIEDALTKAIQAEAIGLQSIRVEFDPETGKIGVYQVLEVAKEVEQPALEIALEEAQKINPDAQVGDLVEKEMSLANFRRIGIQQVKQHIVQRVREIERGIHIERFLNKTGEIITGSVGRVTTQGIIVNLDKIDGVIPNNERIPNEKVPIGKRLKVYVMDVRPGQKDQEIVLSRSHPEFVRKLFELEVPEIAQGVVVIKNIVREPGHRTKMAVISTQEKVDPVGACVGYKGNRVKQIVNELNGEKIDIIHWDEDPAQFIAHSLSPAQVISVEIFNEEHSAEVIVPDTQLSLAIGKNGQNARLASKLTTWKIDILSEGEKEKLDKELKAEKLTEAGIESLNLATRAERLLSEAGIKTVKDLLEKTKEEISGIEGFGDKSLQDVMAKLKESGLILKESPSEEAPEEEE